MLSLTYVGLADPTGYGVSARALVAALRRHGVTVHWVPMIVGGGLGLGYQPAEQAPLPPCSHVLIHTVPEYYPYWRERVRHELGPGTRIWGYTTWETDAMPAHWLPLLDTMDGIIVPCEWNRQVVTRCGLTKPIAVIPHVSQFSGIPTSPAMRTDPALDGRFLFYSISMWNERKAPWLTLQAFLRAFRAADPVALLLKTSDEDRTRTTRHWRNGFRRRCPPVRPAFLRELARFPDRPPVQLIEDVLDDASIAGLHERGDGYVSLTRGEGWGMGAYEAAWFGKPVITTGYGGSLDFLPPDLAGLVNHRLVPVTAARIDSSYTNDQHWAEPDIDHAVRLMRDMAANPEAARLQGQRLQQHVSRQFATNDIAERCIRVLSA